MRAASCPSSHHRSVAALPCSLVLLSVLLLSSASLLTAEASIASLRLLEARAGSTFEYTMYDGDEVTGETYFSGLTTYPYVFNSAMNSFVVSLLNGYLAHEDKSLASLGGTLKTCMGPSGNSTTGVTCYKALLAAAAPSDCPAANVLCCPLFWRVDGQNIETTMSEMDPRTVFWNGRYAINGFFANFSADYLQEHDNCTVPIFDSTNEISLAVDVTGEWRFVSLQTTFVLQETALSVLAAAAAEYFGNKNPQDSLAAANKAQRPIYKSLAPAAPVVVAIILLALIGLFLLLTCLCSVRRTAKGVQERQRYVLDLVSKPQPTTARAVLDEISSESSSGSEAGDSAESRRQMNLTRHSSRYNMNADSDGEEDEDDESGSDGGESYPDDADERQQLTRAASAKTKGSSKSLKSKGSSKSVKSKGSTKSAKSKASSKRGGKKKAQTVEDFPARPSALPGIRAHKGSADSPEAASSSPNANPLQPQKRSSSTGTVVHRLDTQQRKEQQEAQQGKQDQQDTWFA